jgi:hypothetical protein
MDVCSMNDTFWDGKEVALLAGVRGARPVPDKSL